MASVDRSETWMNSLVDYLRDGTLPLDFKEANCIQKKPQWFLLYERDPLQEGICRTAILRCTTREERRKTLEEIHEGECGAHIRGRSLATKASCT